MKLKNTDKNGKYTWLFIQTLPVLQGGMLREGRDHGGRLRQVLPRLVTRLL